MADSEILIESVVPSSATAAETIKYIWSKVNLPESDLEALRLVNSGEIQNEALSSPVPLRDQKLNSISWM